MSLRPSGLCEVALTGLSAVEDLATTFDNPVGPPGIGTFSGNATVTGIAVTVPGGTVSVNPGFDGSTDLELLGPGSGLAPGESATIRVSLDVNNYAIYNNQVSASGTTPVGGSIPDTSTDGTDPDGGDGDGNPDEDVISVLDTSGLPVSLSWFESTTSGEQLVVEWATDVEFGNLGFELHGETRAGERWRLGPLIGSRNGNSTRAQRYRADIDGEDLARLWIADVDRRGRRNWYGPFAIGDAMGRPPVEARIEWQPLATAPQARGASAPEALRVTVSETGLHHLTQADLLAAGLDLAGRRPADLALSLAGVAVPLHVAGDPNTFGLDTRLEFFARQSTGLYTRDRIYRLAFDAAAARPMAVDAVRPGVVRSARYRAADGLETQVVYDHSSPTDDPWRMQQLLDEDGQEPVAAEFAIDVGPGVSISPAATLGIVVHGGQDFPFPPPISPDPEGCGGAAPPVAPGLPQDHCVRVLFDGEVVGELVFDGDIADVGEDTFREIYGRAVTPDDLLEGAEL